jgi:thymidylate kinase/predicted nucleotidyltransferase
MGKKRIIVSLEGVDGSGKSTVINSLVKEIETVSPNQTITTSNMNLSKLSKIYPKNKNKIKEFYTNAKTEKIVEALLEINKNKAKIIKSKKRHIILDRGYLSTVAQCIAHVMSRDKKSYKESKKTVERINKKVNYQPIENQAIVLHLSKKKAEEYFISREKADKSHLKYLKAFYLSFNKLQKEEHSKKKQIKIHKIDASLSKKKVFEQVLEKYKLVTGLGHENLVYDLIEEINKKTTDSIIVGGSYARNDFIPEWSDIDAIIILKNNGNIKSTKKLAKKLSKKHNVRFNPRIIYKSQLKDKKSLELKILVFLMKEYESIPVFGSSYNLNFSKSELKKVANLDYYKVFSFVEELLKNKKTNLNEKVKRGIRNCYIIVKMMLLNKGIIASSYKDTIEKGKRNKIPHMKYLEKFLDIRNDWGNNKLDKNKTIKDIRNFMRRIKCEI